MSEATPSAASDVDEEQFCNSTGASDDQIPDTLGDGNWNDESDIKMHVDGIDTSDSANMIPSADTAINDLDSSIAEDSSRDSSSPGPSADADHLDDTPADGLDSTQADEDSSRDSASPGPSADVEPTDDIPADGLDSTQADEDNSRDSTSPGPSADVDTTDDTPADGPSSTPLNDDSSRDSTSSGPSADVKPTQDTPADGPGFTQNDEDSSRDLASPDPSAEADPTEGTPADDLGSLSEDNSRDSASPGPSADVDATDDTPADGPSSTLLNDDSSRDSASPGPSADVDPTDDTPADGPSSAVLNEDPSSRDARSPSPQARHDMEYDFDIMMQKKKEESSRKRRRKNIDIINDNDDIIAELINQMKQAVEDDFELNKMSRAATSKLRLLPLVETQLRKFDLREAFLDAGVLHVITDWLTPLVDRSLPNLQVRETMLKLLTEFNICDVERLKASGIGRAVMYLYKHPKETKENRRRAGVLIASWSRPIFSLDSDFHAMSKEEREQRDLDHMTKLETKRTRIEKVSSSPSSSKSRAGEERTLRPGDKGWIPRARVPAPSTRDYVVRPKSNVDLDITRSGSKRAVTRLDKHLRNFREKKKMMKVQRAVPISIEGRKMSL
ncbi:uncharacterized protein LOC141855329 [Brevipalpus obovatus]|uniref:uncharacterized protein LOC141855329 n=1 Tax=Brevipalpus obovatus TaxID=246614 RepID=UPI003D9E9D2C